MSQTLGRFNDGELMPAEDWDTAKDAPHLFHGTSTKRLLGILKEGFAAGSCWGSEWVARYFAREECKQNGGRPVVFRLELERFDAKALAPDLQMAEFSIFEDYDVRQNDWEDIEDPNWEDSLRVQEAVLFGEALSVTENDILSGAPRRKKAPAPV